MLPDSTVIDCDIVANRKTLTVYNLATFSDSSKFLTCMSSRQHTPRPIRKFIRNIIDAGKSYFAEAVPLVLHPLLNSSQIAEYALYVYT